MTIIRQQHERSNNIESTSILICSIIIGIILGIVAFIVTDNVIVMSRFSSIICGILVCGLCSIMSIMAIEGVTDLKGDIVIVSCEKIAETNDTANIVNRGWYYEKQKDDGKLIKHNVNDIYFDETVDAVYLRTQYHKLWIFKSETEEVLLIPESALTAIQYQKE